VSDPYPAPPDPVDLARRTADALGAAFDTDGPYSREMTDAVLAALGTSVAYLRTCLGPAQPAAVPDAAALADVVLALHAACGQLRAGLLGTLTAIDRRRLPADRALGIEHIAATRAALAQACDALLAAAHGFADAHHAATEAPPGTRTRHQPGTTTT